MVLDRIKDMSFEEIRDQYTEYLKAQELSPLTIQTSRSDAFYLLRHDDSLDFWALLQSEDFETEAFAHLQSVLSANSKGNITSNINSYMAQLRRFRRFLYSDGEIPEVPKKHAGQKEKSRKAKTVYAGIPTPSAQAVMHYQISWEELDSYREQERALNRLFFDLAPENKDIADILLKVTTLNQFYSTNIFSIYPVAEHIKALDIDMRLKAGDESLVDDIRTVEFNGKKKSLYSFASKYCSHHNPDAYPIYDSYVDEVLRYFRNTDCFTSFRTEELKDYKRFKEILMAFQTYYGLEQFSLKEIDKYLWQFGKEYFPKKYHSRKREETK